MKNNYNRPDLSSDEDDDENQENVPDMLPPIGQPNQRLVGKSRTSVASEVFNIKASSLYIPKVVKKTEQQKEKIRTRLGQAFMFSALDEREKSIVIDAMEEKRVRTGEEVISQGDKGDVLYMVDSGRLDCFKEATKDQPRKLLKTYQPGEAFGELALLYNAPRAATIVAKESSVLYSLDRECFNNIVKGASIRKREKYNDFLKHVEILATLNEDEKAQVCDCLKPQNFKAGEFIIKEGEQGNEMYFIEEGKATATKKNQGKDEKVFEFGPNDYFGELALINDTKRQASVQATSALTVVSIDRNSFNRLFGNAVEVMKRNSSKYDKEKETGGAGNQGVGSFESVPQEFKPAMVELLLSQIDFLAVMTQTITKSLALATSSQEGADAVDIMIRNGSLGTWIKTLSNYFLQSRLKIIDTIHDFRFLMGNATVPFELFQELESACDPLQEKSKDLPAFCKELVRLTGFGEVPAQPNLKFKEKKEDQTVGGISTPYVQQNVTNSNTARPAPPVRLEVVRIKPLVIEPRISTNRTKTETSNAPPPAPPGKLSSVGYLDNIGVSEIQNNRGPTSFNSGPKSIYSGQSTIPDTLNTNPSRSDPKAPNAPEALPKPSNSYDLMKKEREEAENKRSKHY